MLFKHNTLKKNLLLSLFLIFSLLLFAACSSDGASNSNSEGEENTTEENENMEEGEHETEHEMDHEHDEGRIPNPDGAAVSILSPADGATFAAGDEVIVEVQVENFTIGEDGNHWHVYVDGTSWGMVEGGNTSQSLRGLETGEHVIEVHIAGGDHIEFEDGDTIHITVE
jgi:hypothetical protein